LRRSAAIVTPLTVWLAALVTLSLVAGLAGDPPWHSATWARWDSAHYQEIARRGYTLFRCANDWCGNAGWFPGYPWLIRAVSATGLPLRATAVGISWAFAAATLALLWSTFLAGRTGARTIAALAYAAWAPGQVFEDAVFPLSLLTFFTVAFLWLVHRRRWLAAGVAGGLAALAYPIGLTLAPVGAVWLALTRPRRTLRAATLVVVPTALAAAAIAVTQQIETGHWDAYLEVQAKYGHGLHEPLGQTWNAVVPLTRGHPFARVHAPALQTVVISAVLLAVALELLLRRRDVGRREGLLALWAAVTWALPLTQANFSIWRSQAALLPVAALLQRLPTVLVVAAAASAAAVGVPLALLWFHGQLP
jgi:hypothetical protein